MEKICIIVPCYNEEKRLPLPVFEQFTESNAAYDFCFVNDGSRDRTAEMLQEFVKKCPEHYHICDRQKNKGKAEAVRSGILEMTDLKRYDYVGYLDADLATPLEELSPLMEVFKREPCVRFVMGIRLKRLGANIQRKNFRHYMGRFFATVVSVLYRLPVYDSQCGAKIIKADLATEIFKQPFESNWLFDIELILRVRELYPLYDTLIREVPLREWIEKGESRIKFFHLLKMPGQLFRIYRKYR